MSMHDDLIEAYGVKVVDSVTEIETSASFQELLAKHSGKAGFDPECAYVGKLRATIQRLLAKQRPESQVRISLKLLYQTRNEDTRRDYQRLIKLAFLQDWSDPQQAHFDRAYSVISGNVYYFLSFTNHNLTHGFANIVNRNHRSLIEDVFYNQKPQEIGDFAKENLLAKVVWYFLESYGLKGFYYPLHQGNNAVVREKLSSNLQATLTFVQIVHTAIFDKDPEANYCFFEYDNVRASGLCRKRYFILADSRADLKVHALPHDHFEPWRGEIIDLVDALELEPSEYYDDAVLRRNTKLIKEKIVKEIEKSSSELFDNVPP